MTAMVAERSWIYITPHAIDRYIERIEAVSRDDAVALIRAAEPAIRVAKDFGATVVKMKNGARLVCEGRKVVTVMHPHCFPRDLMPRSSGMDARQGDNEVPPRSGDSP